jgi:hypothetical protein
MAKGFIKWGAVALMTLILSACSQQSCMLTPDINTGPCTRVTSGFYQSGWVGEHQYCNYFRGKKKWRWVTCYKRCTVNNLAPDLCHSWKTVHGHWAVSPMDI